MISPKKWLLAGAATLGIVVIALGMREPPKLVELVPARTGPFSVSFQEEGKTRLRERFLVTTPTTGFVRRIALEEGDSVVAGQVVAEIEALPSPLLDPGMRARSLAEVDAAEDAVRSATARTSAARAASNLAKSEYERLLGMTGDAAVSKSQLDAARTRASQAASELLAAEAEERASESRKRVAVSGLHEEGRPGATAKVLLRAPVAGAVIRRYRESAGSVAAGAPVLEIGRPGDLEIEVEALSTDAVKLRPGLAARILRWGGDAALAAKIERIEPGGFTKVSALGVEEQRVRVILSITSPPEAWGGLGDAYRVEVEFLLRESEKVLQIPSSALFREGEGWAAFVEKSGRAEKRKVEIGAKGGLVTEVRGGITEGERVVAFPDDEISPGARLREAKRK